MLMSDLIMQNRNFKRWIVISDIHGNLQALKQMLLQEQITKDDLVICCGDIVAYYYDEVEVLKLFKKIPNFYMVKGNHDDYYCQNIDSEKLKCLVDKYGTVYKKINQEVKQFLSDLPTKIESVLNGYSVCIVHGGLNDNLEERIYPDTKLAENQYDIVFMGHTHYQLEKKIGKTLYVNPGSLGQPRDCKGFSYCVVDDFFDLKMKMKTVSVDIEQLQQQCIKNEGKKTYSYEVLERNK